jgi:hypothetical protein
MSSSVDTVIRYSADTSAVLAAIAGMEQRERQFGAVHGEQMMRQTAALESLTRGWRRANDALDLMGKLYRNTIGRFISFGEITHTITRHTLQLEEAQRGVAFGLRGVIENAFRATGVTESMSSAIDSLVAAIGDSENPIGRFVRDGLGGVVSVGVAVIGTLGEIMIAMHQFGTDLGTVVDEAVTDVGRLFETVRSARRGERWSAVVAGAPADTSDRILGGLTQHWGLEGTAVTGGPTEDEQRQASLDAAAARIRGFIQDAVNFQGEFQAGLNANVDTSNWRTGGRTPGGRGRGGRQQRATSWSSGMGAWAESREQSWSPLGWMIRAIESDAERIAAAFGAASEAVIEGQSDFAAGIAGLGRGGAVAGGAAGGGGEGARTFDPLKPLADALDGLPALASGAFSDTFVAVGKFASGVKGAFRDLGQAIKQTLGSTFSSIGSALSMGALEALAGGAALGGPLGIALAAGALFSIVGGLLTGGGSGATAGASRGVGISPDVISSARGDMRSSAGITNHYHVHAGAVFGDLDSATQGMARLYKRAKVMGEV